MKWCIGIRREDRDPNERRTPLIPRHARLLAAEGIRVVVQPSKIRIHRDAEYEAAGAEILEDLGPCQVIAAVKEIPIERIQENKAYLFFSHTIKGQPQNMPLLKRIVDLGCTLIDYEPIRNRRGRRLIGFGRHAGLAGMVDTLWALGKRLEADGLSTPFSTLQQATRYGSLSEARLAVAEAGQRIAAEGLPPQLVPLVCGIVGYGNVSRGAQEIFDLLPVRYVDPPDLARLEAAGDPGNRVVFKTVFSQEHCYERRDGGDFDLNDYLESPEKYRPVFARFAPYVTVLVNAIYWDLRYPKLLTRHDLRELWAGDGPPKLKVIGDITCDIDGSIESTIKATSTQRPTFLYLPDEHRASEAWTGRGPVVMAVDNLPCEFSREASEDFSRAVLPVLSQIVRSYSGGVLDIRGLSPSIQKAVIVNQGKLTPAYKYLETHLR